MMLRKNDDILTKTLIFCLICACVNVFLFELYFIVAAFVLLILRDRKIVVNQTTLLLFLFVVSYMLFYGIHGGFLSTSVFRILTVLMAYMIGYCVYDEPSSQRIKSMLLLMAAAMAAHSILNMVYNITQSGISVFYSGRTVDFWSGSISSATGQAAYYFMIAGCLGYIVCGSGEMKSRMWMLGIYAVAFIHNLLLGGRTFLVLSLTSLIVGIVFSAVKSKNKRKLLTICIVSASIIGMIVLAYMLNWFGLRDFFQSSFFYYRFFITDSFSLESERMERRFLYIKNMFRYPFGGNNIRRHLGVGYAHDLWLDVYDDAGMIAFILLLVSTILSVRRAITLVRENQDENMTHLLLGLYVTLLASFLVEPILAGCPIVLVVYFLMDGLVSKYIDRKI